MLTTLLHWLNNDDILILLRTMQLTYWGLVTPLMSVLNGLLPDTTKPLVEAVWTH